MFENKTLSEITEKDLEEYYKAVKKHKEPNHRIEGKGGYMQMILDGAKKMPKDPQKKK